MSNWKAKLRNILTFWVAPDTIDHLESIRKYELERVLPYFEKGKKMLEIGAGAGWQAKTLQEKGFDIEGIDLKESNLVKERIWPVIDYDGKNIPFPDETFDIIFSSNVLEHIPHVAEFQSEIKRVLKKDGIVVHILPSGTWRFFTNITVPLKLLIQPRVHGEHAKNSLHEIYLFSKLFWTRFFKKSGWNVRVVTSNKLFYTGVSIMDCWLTIGARKKLSFLLGSSCNIFIMDKHLD